MTKRLSIVGSSGLRLAALFDAPAAQSPHPLVILLHGFTGWKEEEHLSSLAADLAEAGIAALRFDAPGSGESEGTWAEHYRISNYRTAVHTFRDYAVAHLGADPRRIGIWGHSMGGLIALELASEEPDKFIALCANEPSSGKDYRDLETWKSNDSRHFSNSHFADIDLPWAFYADRMLYNRERLPAAKKLRV